MSNLVSNTGLSPICGTNLGGLNHLRLIQHLAVLSIQDPIRFPTPIPYTISTDGLRLRPQAAFVDVFFQSNRGGFSEPEITSSQGAFHRPVINVAIPQDRPEVAAWYYGKQNQKFIAFYADANDRYKIVGSIDNPLSIRLDLSVGTRYSDGNGYVLSLSGEQPHKSFFIEDIADAVLFTPPEFSFGFSLGFLA